MKVTCINDKDRPSTIPISQWIERNSEYTIVELVKCNVQGGLLGYKLAEISLNGCEPYTCYAANRFSIPVPEETLEEVEELAV